MAEKYRPSLLCRQSLRFRLFAPIIAAQALAVVLAMAAFPFVSPYVSAVDIAAKSTEMLVRLSLTRAADGHLVIHPIRPLVEYAARRPGLAYGVLDGSLAQLVEGSDPVLLPVVERLRGLALRKHADIEFPLAGRPHAEVKIEVANSDVGQVTIISTGNSFGADDTPAFVMRFMPALLPIFGPVLFAALVVVPIVVTRSMRGVRVAADEASEIDMRSLDRRLSTRGVPLEILPLVEAVNAVLGRLREGVGRERLFAANAAHELRTPVAILLARIDAGQGDARHKQELKRDAQRIGLLVEQLLAVARLDHHGVTLDEEIELVASVRGLIADRAPLAIRMRRNLVFAPPRGAVMVLGHARALESAIANLLDNALAVEPECGSVDVSIAMGADGHVVLQIADHGPGIDDAERDLVFQPFWRKDERRVGSGLGMTIAQKVVVRHGGAIDISVTPGGGATLRVTLPCRHGPAMAPAPSPAQSPAPPEERRAAA